MFPVQQLKTLGLFSQVYEVQCEIKSKLHPYFE